MKSATTPNTALPRLSRIGFLLKRSIFIRVYTGLTILIILVAALAYVLVQGINYHRAQNYREQVTDGIFYVIAKGAARQPDLQSMLDWVSDASKLTDMPVRLIKNDVNFSVSEKKRLNNNQAVVRYHSDTHKTDVYTFIPDYPQYILHAVIDKFEEQQIKSMAIFMLEDLMYYVGSENERLAELATYFSYPVYLEKISNLKLDSEQLGRVRRTEVILLFSDSGSGRGASISLIAPTPYADQVLVMGPSPTFNLLPFSLFGGVTLFSLFLLSLGVYTLIVPIQRKVVIIRNALNQVRSGDLSTRLEVRGQDELANVIYSFNTMTAHIQRLIEAQQELTRAVSHELRTPVARLRFGMDMLADTPDYDHRMQQLELLDKDIDELNNLIDEILTFAKLEQGTPALNFKALPLADILLQIVQESRSLPFTADFQYRLPASDIIVEVDELYLHRLLQNLVGNALRYGDGVVRICGGSHNGKAFVSVEDNGSGIPESERERVLEPFARLDDSRTRASGGYGLGLSIVNRIAYWFDGSVEIDQSPSLGGARFTIKWPAQQKLNSKS